MSNWPSCKPAKVYKALLKIGWDFKREAKGSHLILQRDGYADFTWSFHDGKEIGPKMLARIAKRTGLKPEDL